MVRAARRRPGWAVGLFVLACAGGAWAGHHVWTKYCIDEARRLLTQRDDDGAQIQIAACLERWPRNPVVCVLAARAARLRQQPLEAANLLDQAQRLDGNVERIVLEKYLLRAERGELDQVEKKLLAFVHKNDPDAVFILDVLTYQWMRMHRLSDALSRLDAWLSLQPDHPEPHLRRAWVLERLRDFSAALTEYQEALDLDPDRDRRHNDRIRLRLAELLVERFRPKDAVAHFDVLVERQPSNVTVLLGLARCRLQLGQTDDAMRLLETIVQAEPTHGRALGELGRMLLEQERLVEAETRLRQAFAQLPRDRHIVFSLEQCLQKLGKKEEAGELQQRFERIRIDEKRMAELMTAVQRSPEDPAVRQRIGEIFLRNGMAQDGVFWLESALSYDEHYVPAREVLAEWWESRNAPDQAAPHRQVLERLGVGKSVNRFAAPK